MKNNFQKWYEEEVRQVNRLVKQYNLKTCYCYVAIKRILTGIKFLCRQTCDKFILRKTLSNYFIYTYPISIPHTDTDRMK